MTKSQPLIRYGSLVSLLFALGACESKDAAKPAETPSADEPAAADPAPAIADEAAAPAPVANQGPAAIGKPAPQFALRSAAGKQVKLADFKGKTVVLEWFNPECPFVKLSHTKGSLKGLADKYDAKGDIVWLAINSGGAGRQGHGVEKNRESAEDFGMKYPVLLDETGSVGKVYAATNTPHMFIIDKQGTLVYSGAIDNSPDGEGQSPSEGTLVNYVSQALEELEAGKPVSVPKTKAYGCSVKYAS